MEEPFAMISEKNHIQEADAGIRAAPARQEGGRRLRELGHEDLGPVLLCSAAAL